MRVDNKTNKIRYIITANDLSLLIDKREEIENEINVSVMIVRSNFLIFLKNFLFFKVLYFRFVNNNNKIPKLRAIPNAILLKTRNEYENPIKYIAKFSIIFIFLKSYIN